MFITIIVCFILAFERVFETGNVTLWLRTWVHESDCLVSTLDSHFFCTRKADSVWW